MDIRVYKSFDKELRLLWSNFEQTANSLAFQSYEWQHYWYNTVGQPKFSIDLCIVACFAEGELQAIFPFGVRHVLGARVLEFLGVGEADYSAPLIGVNVSAQKFRDIWNLVMEAVSEHDVIHFKNIPQQIGKNNNFLLENISAKEVGLTYSVTLPDTCADYKLKLSKRLIKDNRVMVRKLSKLGQLKFLVLENKEEFNKVLCKTISQKEDRYVSSGARNIFLNKAVKEFYTGIYSLLEKGFQVHLSALMLNDEVLATHLGIRHRDQFYYLMPTFNHDSKWKKFSLGRIHLEKLTCWAINNGIRNFDFTIGGEVYKRIWCNTEMPIFTYLRLRSIKGSFYCVFIFLLEWIKSKPYLKRVAARVFNFKQKLQILRKILY